MILRKIVVPFLIIVAVCAAFANAVTDGHLAFDDWGYIYGCEFVKSGLSWTNIRSAFTDLAHGAIWMPLTYISYMADITLFHGGWEVHHTINVLLHAVNAVFVYFFVCALISPERSELCEAKWLQGCDHALPSTNHESRITFLIPLVAALIWAIHPMRADAVAWVASRKELLWSMFGLLFLRSWLGVTNHEPRTASHFLRYLISLVWFIAALLCKPTAACLPFIALMFDWLDAARGRAKCSPLPYIPMIALSLAAILLGAYSQFHPTGIETQMPTDTSFLWRLLNATVTFGLQIYHQVVPVGLSVFHRSTPGAWPVGSVIGITVALLVVAVVVRFWRQVWLPFVWFSLSLLPTLGLIAINGDQAYAERYAYFPSIAIALMAVRAVAHRPQWLLCGCLLLVGEFALLRPLTASYATDYTAFSRTLAIDPDDWKAMRVIGSEYCARLNRMDDGIALLRRSHVLHPSQTTVSTLAYVLAVRGKAGDLDETMRLAAPIAKRPELDRGGMMLDALGIATMRRLDFKASADWFARSLAAPNRKHYSREHTMLNFGLSLANLGKRKEALIVLGRLHRSPNDAVRKRAKDASAKILANNAPRYFLWRE